MKESFHVESPPPQQPPDSLDETTLIDINNRIQPGRLSIVCIEAANLRRKDTNESKTLLNPRVQITLGQNCLNPLVQISKHQQCMNQSPSFENEILSFDIQNPQDIMCGAKKDIKLKIEVLDQSILQSFIIGEVIISASRFFDGSMTKEWIPLFQHDDKSSNSSIHLQFMYMPVREGMLMLTLMQSKRLLIPKSKTIPSHTKLVFSIGQNVLQESMPVEEESGNPTYSSERVYLDVSKNNWFHDMKVAILNLTTETKDIFGEHMLNLIPLMNKDFAMEEETLQLPLYGVDENRNIVGNLNLRVEFLHSSKMKVKLIQAKSLKSYDALASQKISPFVIVKSEGRSSCPSYQSRTIRAGGTTPVWDEDFIFTLVDHNILSIECYDYDFFTNMHQLIGSGRLSLLPAYRTGLLSTWVNLTRSNEVGAMLPCGQVNVEFRFEDVGSGFPKLHDSSVKSTFKSVQNCTRNNSLQPLAQEIVKDMREKDDTGEDFTDEDIRSTFKFLDLDKNGYIGTAELRHVLINMGELITEEEVDKMISMLDKNGDGQVNFQQFEAMAKSTNSKRIETSSQTKVNDLSKQQVADKNDSNMDVKRRKQFKDFIFNNKISKIDVSDLREYFLRRHRAFVSSKNQDINTEDYPTVWKLDFDTFCQILPIESTGESQEVFNLFDYNKDSVIDIRELTLSLCNFITTFSAEEKCSLMFELFGDKEDYITAKDLEVILSGTHLKHKSEISRKVQTILKLVDKEDTKKMTKELLLKAAISFPNLLLPKLAT